MKTWHTIIYAVTYKNSNIVYIHLHIFERNGYIELEGWLVVFFTQVVVVTQT